ncbi:hypothetical protein RA27_08850 [Ruegeria sp. ANG-R]|nr:hypothetical protein RA27_08850 [Ruegeria sp. ANG-R]
MVADSYGAWSGTEVEVGEESLYFSGGDGSNLVIELDGNSGVTSVVEQSFFVAGDDKSATLSFDIGARNTSGTTADPVLVQVLDAGNNVVFAQTVNPTTVGSFDRVEFEFDFGAEGTYTLRFTEQGNNNSLGTILDNVSLMVCFTSGTRILTPEGEVEIDDLEVGDLVTTLDGAPQPIQWIGSKKLDRIDLLANPKMRPVMVRKDALGPGMPNADLLVSPQHRLMVRSKVAQRVLGDFEALIPARKLTRLPGVDVVETCEEVAYFHFALEQHSIVVAQQAYTESLYFGPEALKVLGSEAMEELTLLFPELFDDHAHPVPARALHSHRKQIDRLCERLVQNSKPAVELSA